MPIPRARAFLPQRELERSGRFENPDSFDCFADFEERGDSFIRFVENLNE